MNTHYHLILHCPRGNLSEAMHWLGGVYTQRFNRRHGTDGALYRGRFRSKPIDDDGYLMAATAYIARNPLPIVGASMLHTYPWSSHAPYLGRGGPAWLRRDFVLALFGGEQDAYRAFVDREENAPAAGSLDVELDDFPRALVEALEAEICRIAACELASLRTGRRGATNLPRLTALILIDEYTSLTTEAVHDHYGFATSSAARTARQRARQLLQSDPAFARLVDRARAAADVIVTVAVAAA